METILTNKSKEVIIGDELPTVLIGERINPTGKPWLGEAMQRGNFDLICKLAREQVDAGADVLDVNGGVLGVNEVTLLSELVQAIMEAVNVPLCIDSNNHKALEAGLKIYQGIPIVNSVSGEERSLKEVLPLIKEYGAVVIGLTVDDEGIPADTDRRRNIAHKIMNSAESFGIPHEKVIIDCLATTVGADKSAGQVTLKAIREIKTELGVNMTLGASNVSFGLPNREIINSTFLAMAIEAGINCPILNVSKVKATVLAADLVLGRDLYAKRFSKYYRDHLKNNQ
jgi:5-methyltetrahydrofolate--homocysteine methyltransferase